VIGFRRLSLAIALASIPLAAEAQPFQGLYVGAGAGYNLPQDVDVRGGRAAGLPVNLGSSLKLNGMDPSDPAAVNTPARRIRRSRRQARR